MHHAAVAVCREEKIPEEGKGWSDGMPMVTAGGMEAYRSRSAPHMYAALFGLAEL